MSSMRRILSSQANGACSTGPRTPAGIARSSGNALRHGLLAKCTVLSNESPAHFAQLLDQYAARLNPADDVEFGIVEEMVSSCWRLRRLWAIETRTLQNALADTPDTDELGRITDRRLLPPRLHAETRPHPAL
jgi:hypothetical protein